MVLLEGTARSALRKSAAFSPGARQNPLNLKPGWPGGFTENRGQECPHLKPSAAGSPQKYRPEIN
jgi:hypothetical protein